MDQLGSAEYAEVVLYGDVTLRLINTKNFRGKFLPNFIDVATNLDTKFDYGIKKFDHIVGNLFTLQPTMDHIKNMTVREDTMGSKYRSAISAKCYFFRNY